MIVKELYLSSEQFSCCDIARAQTIIWREALKFEGPILTEILSMASNLLLFKNSAKEIIKLLDRSLSNFLIEKISFIALFFKSLYPKPKKSFVL